MQRIVTIIVTAINCSLVCCAFGAPNKAVSTKELLKTHHSILSNPVGARDNYTINSNHNRSVSIECVFINSANKPADFNIYTNPKSTQPNEEISLQTGSKGKPFQLIKKFELQLKKRWWCRVFAPTDNQKKWEYCAYFSVADSQVHDNNPFNTSIQVPRSTDISYHCRMQKPSKNLSFFYHEPGQ